MANKASNLSDLVQRVASSCFLHPLSFNGHHSSPSHSLNDADADSVEDYDSPEETQAQQDHEQRRRTGGEDEGEKDEIESWERRKREMRSQRLLVEMDTLMNEIFDAVSAVKRSYVALQEAHNPWDADRMRAADVAVVGELRRLGVLRERYRKSATYHGGAGVGGGGMGSGVGVREVVAPYEAVVEELKSEVKEREVEVENLKERLRCLGNGDNDSNDSGKKKKGRSLSKKKLGGNFVQGTFFSSPDFIYYS